MDNMKLDSCIIKLMNSGETPMILCSNEFFKKNLDTRDSKMDTINIGNRQYLTGMYKGTAHIHCFNVPGEMCIVVPQNKYFILR